MKVTTEQFKATEKTIRKIAEFKIKAYGLSCTVDEYIAKATIHDGSTSRP